MGWWADPVRSRAAVRWATSFASIAACRAVGRIRLEEADPVLGHRDDPTRDDPAPTVAVGLVIAITVA